MLVELLTKEAERLQTLYNEQTTEARRLRSQMEAGRIESFDVAEPAPPPKVEVVDQEALERELLHMFQDFQRALEPDSDVEIPGIRVVKGERVQTTPDKPKANKKTKETVPA
jgi:hypothetical protein